MDMKMNIKQYPTSSHLNPLPNPLPNPLSPLLSSLSRLAYVLNALNGQLHGPVHIMIGGQWDLSSSWSSYMNEMTFADNFLLLAKVRH